ncbi:MAG: phosphoglucosamine mutase [Candidatus Zixiibacteriota bacterium]
MGTPELVKSTSGIRGVVGNGLDPVMITAYGAAFGTFLKKGPLVIGRDSRPSGEMVSQAVIAGLVATGINVIDIGIVPTPTVEIAITKLKARGGICVTASHNPSQWNALKFFNARGEFITPEEYARLDAIFNAGQFAYQPYQKLGIVTRQTGWVDKHVAGVLAIRPIDKTAIRKRRFKVVVDAINGAGSVALPSLLEKLGARVVRLNCNGNGDFVHMPEPTPKNLRQLARAVKQHRADLGMACDPDADRLALVDERGRAVSEELTLTIAVKQVLGEAKGAVVINLSTSSATADVAGASGANVHYSRVGESNVVQMMREKRAVIGGEGNGGVIYPAFHAGRDSLVAAALVLACLTREKRTLSSLVETFPSYYTIKGKAALSVDFTQRLQQFEQTAGQLMGTTTVDRRDGLRFDFSEGWLQLRSSNTEPIFRLIVETRQKQLTETLYNQVMSHFA